MDGVGPQQSAGRQVRLTLGSVLLVIAGAAGAVVVAHVAVAARRPLAWAVAASVVAWLLSGVVALLTRWLPRRLAFVVTVLGLVTVAGGNWVGFRATLGREVERLATALPAAAKDLEARYHALAELHLTDRTQEFVHGLVDRFGTHALVPVAARTASTYFVTGVLVLFLVGYGRQYVAAALGQIPNAARRASVTAVTYQASDMARTYLLIALAQVIVVTATCTVVFFLLDLPAPFVLGAIVGWLSVIPYVGIILGGLAPLLAAATEPHVLTYVILAVLLVGLQVVEAAVVRPRTDRRTLRVGPALTLAATLIGYDVYGFGGALYGMTLVVLLWAVVRSLPEAGAQAPVGDAPEAGRPAGP